MDEFSKENRKKEHKRLRTSEDFYLFCTYVLEYENYNAQKTEELRDTINQCPTITSSRNSVNSESNSDTISLNNDYTMSEVEIEEEGDSHGLVTCFCQKPFAGRPMIECSRCFTWVHLSCARIKKNNIPDVFHCAMCKDDHNYERKREGSPLLFNSKRHKKT